MNWRVKSLIQKTLGYVPAGERLHYELQRKVGGLRNMDGECIIKIQDWGLMVGHMRAIEQPLKDAVLMEMGTGWYPTLPLCSYIAGAGKVHTLDLNRLMKPELTVRLAELIGDQMSLVKECSDLSAGEVHRRHDHALRVLRAGGSIEDATEGVVEYRAPADARHTDLPDASIDWTMSNNTLEHVPADDIAACMREAMRILRPGKYMYHSVNCGDHYAYNDASINQLNYLQFSEEDWQLWQNDFLWQNRLRAKDFVAMTRDVGFEVIVDTTEASERNLGWLASVDVHPSFSSRYTPEELCVTTVDIVGRKPA